MRVIQALIVGAVVASNIQWKWTENGYGPILLGVLAAYLLTVLPFQIFHQAKLLFANRRAIREWEERRLRRQAEAERSRHDGYLSLPGQSRVELQDRQE